MKIILINEDTKNIELTCRKLPRENVYRVVAKLKAKIEVGYSLLVPDKEKKRIQKLTEKRRTAYGNEVLKKSNGDVKKAISLICASKEIRFVKNKRVKKALNKLIQKGVLK